MQLDFNEFRNFDYSGSTPYLWVFKKSTTQRKFSAYFVPTDEVLNSLLKGIAQAETRRITEFTSYTYLAEVNDNSCLATPSGATDFQFLKDQISRPEPEHAARSIKDLKGAEGYVVKFLMNGQIVYAVKRSTTTWKTAYPKKFINMVFLNGELTAAADNGFSIERNFDFYVINDITFIASKRGFEAAMTYKAAYAQAFTSLRQNQQFSNLFTHLQPLIDHVGNNSIQLRRMAVIEQKGLYNEPNFLQSLQQVNARRGYGINFDPITNRIVPCENTAKTILQVLLDHRLISEITETIYDVPDAVRV